MTGIIDPALFGMPDATTTGVAAGTTLTAYTGPMTITTPGTVIEGKVISGTLRVTAADVTIKNCIVQNYGWWGIDAEGAANITVQNCDFTASSTADTNAAILGSGTFIGNDIRNSENGIVLTGGASVVRDNYIHDLRDSGPDPHLDGISVQGGQNHVLIEHNTVESWDTSCIFIKNDFGPINDITVRNNLLYGDLDRGDPAATIYVYGPNTTNVSIMNNYVEKGFWFYYSTDNANPTISGNIEWNNNTDPTPYPNSPPPPTTGAVSINDVTISEGNSGTNTATFTVTRSGGTAAFDVNFATSDGTSNAAATVADSDYIAANNTLHFGANENTKTISVTINGDTKVESNETFNVLLSNATNGATISDPQGVGTITNDDGSSTTNLVVNGGFETGTFSGWVVGNYQPEQILITSNAHSGQFAAALGPAGSDGSLSENLATVAGQHYTLHFSLANMSSGSNDFSVHWDGTTVLAVVDAPSQSYTDYTFDVVATDNNTHLEFDFRQDPTQWRLDDVSVLATGTSEPPPPTDTSGNDVLVGTTGADLLAGGAGDDTYTVNSIGDQVIELANNGTDNVETTISYALPSNVENLQLTGGGAINGAGNDLNNIINGNDASNLLEGGAGNDTLNGRGGDDTLFGDSGNDVFQFSSQFSANGDKVMDFVHGIDKLDFSQIDSRANRTGDQSFIFDGYDNGGRNGHLWAVEDQAAGVTHVYAKTGGFQFHIDLQGVHVGLTASDFIL